MGQGRMDLGQGGPFAGLGRYGKGEVGMARCPRAHDMFPHVWVKFGVQSPWAGVPKGVSNASLKGNGFADVQLAPTHHDF